MGDTNLINCSSLVSRTSFASYIQLLNATTGFNLTLLEACKGDICNALWGDGNSDIAGIGVSFLSFRQKGKIRLI
jgi:hypothetical protein